MFLVIGTILVVLLGVTMGSLIAPSLMGIIITVVMVVVARVIGRKYDSYLIALYGSTTVAADVLSRTEAMGEAFNKWFDESIFGKIVDLFDFFL